MTILDAKILETTYTQKRHNLFDFYLYNSVSPTLRC